MLEAGRSWTAWCRSTTSSQQSAAETADGFTCGDPHCTALEQASEFLRSYTSIKQS